MNDHKVNHDATASTRGTLHQMWVAVEKCFEMHADGQKILIEKQGDVSGDDQIEVKRYTDNLTDNHLCFWKTLNNWVQPSFDPKQYHSLILLTTQEFGPSATIANWNNESVAKRLQIIKAIYETNKGKYGESSKADSNKQKPESFRLQQSVFADDKHDKLDAAIERFYIEAMAPDTPELYNRIKGQYLKGVLEGKKDAFLDSLFGYISQPKNERCDRWEISYTDFKLKVQELTTMFCRDTKIFPRINIGDTDTSLLSDKNHLFVNKILDIEYSAVVRKAVEHYHIAFKTINEEFKSYSVPHERTEKYSQDVVEQFEAKYRFATRNCKDAIRDSQDLYDKVTGSTPIPLPGFDATPLSFRNGVLHLEMNDEGKSLKWKVEPSEQVNQASQHSL